MFFSVKHPLLFVIALGLIARLIFIFASNHIYYPDEIFQTQEASLRLITNHGIIPWDYDYKIRSYAIPLFLSLPLKICFLLGLTSPHQYIPITKSFLALFSLILIPAGYFLTKLLTPSKNTKNQQIPTIAALIIALWYELIYFSSRALTEVIGVNFYALSFLIFYFSDKRPRTKYFYVHQFLGYFTLGLATLIRPQYFPLSILFIYWQFHQSFNPPRKYAMLTFGLSGLFLAVFLFGLVDYYAYGHFLSHLGNNLKVSYGSGISAIFGIKPWWYYLVSLSVTSGGLFLVSLSMPKSRTFLPLYLTIFSILVIHSKIPHKEYRFIYLLIPLTIILFSLKIFSAHKIKSNAATSRLVIIAVISLLGMLNLLPYQSLVYSKPLLLKDSSLKLYQNLALDPQLCGLYDNSREWVYTGGIYYLNRSIPLYSTDYPPSDLNQISHYISTSTTAPSPEFKLIKKYSGHQVIHQSQKIQNPALYLYKRVGECDNNPNYSNHRTFPFIESILNSQP